MVWYVHFPGDVYALSLPRDITTERQARQYARDWLGGWLKKDVKRLPDGTGVWCSKPWW